MGRLLFVVIICLILTGVVFSFNLVEESLSDLKSLKPTIYQLTFLPLFLIDREIQNMFSSKYEIYIVDFINKMDVKDFVILTSVLSFITYFNDPYLSFTILESVTVNSFITYGLKFFIGRARPTYSDSPFLFKPFSLENEFNSLPSGHSSFAWALFTPIAEKYGKIFYMIPVIFSISRVIGDYHWFSDVVAGAIIGYTIGKVFFQEKSVP
ncbi:phosphatase PAP2 family protein [Thermosipho atlanticus]|uniref:PAP2 superfamily protein n=1 Tax=Thermosipho atlanticus DSM 15807 TaxID=1123380 RepID=A0A1M5QS36_9BACT|nr:phosphatase PAP2 family protein [Thermosipho atlanticus]SHH16927.1 PAP2 superfamily protein [Thermosipho atlanticus DSM 15807]